MAVVAFWKQIEQFLYFSFFYSTLFIIFLVSIWETTHAWINVPLTGIYHSLTSDYNFFHALWLTASGLLSSPKIIQTILGSIAVSASFVASVFCIRYILGYNWQQTMRSLTGYLGMLLAVYLLVG